MNQHIEKLLFEVVAMEGEDGELYPSLYTKDQIEEFAQLIIKECAQIALVEDFDPSDCILRHFGLLK
jgi:hypothetical protein